MLEDSEAPAHTPPRCATTRRFVVIAGALLWAALPAIPGCRTGPDPPPWLAWRARPPVDCALGYSGATLYPGDALRQSRVDALTGLLRRFDETRLESESFDDGETRIAWTHQVSRGRLAGARIVAMWSDRERAEASGGVYALACLEGVRPEGLEEMAAPDWVMNPPQTDARLCAPAVAGPTLLADDQRPAAIADGRAALADALESEVEQIVVDDERHRTFEHSTLSATGRARARADAARELEREWLDEEGVGPLGVDGTLYGMVCIDR